MFPIFRRSISACQKRRQPAMSRFASTELLETREMLAADLTIVNPSIFVLTQNQDNTVGFTVRLAVGNTGDQAVIVNNVSIQAYISADEIYGNQGDLPAGSVSVDLNLIANTVSGTKQLFGTVTLANYQAASFLLVKVDDGNDVAEGNENNNVASLALPGLPTISTSQGQTQGKTNKVVIVDSQFAFSDPDTSDFNGGQLKVAVANDEGDINILSMKKLKTEGGTARIKKGELKFGKTVIGTVAGGTNSAPLIITFTNEMPGALVEAIGKSITLRGKKGSPGVRTVQFQVIDASNVKSQVVSKDVSLVD